ncbi:ephrin-B3 [Cuculus canorus]|uniref:ephrin-B3 n=1 Tax=Cuculus canorus TaxID=55661 RepID=UPI0023AB118E|nr:ephrin-B3 [Cuculus canorus]
MAGRCAALLVAVLGAAGMSLEPIVWHSGNRRFLTSGGYTLYPQIGDRLDLLCPKGGILGSPPYEYYKLYLVGGAQARRCRVPPDPTLLLTCDRPRRDLRFTLKFQEFSPNLWGYEFRRFHDYYIITTSDGTPEGLENREGGACRTHGMRVTLRVGQRPGAAPESEGTAAAANQTSVPPPDFSPPGGSRWVFGGAGGGTAALLTLLGLGGALWWRYRPPRRTPKTPRGRGHPPLGPPCPLRDLPPPTAPPNYYKV